VQRDPFPRVVTDAGTRIETAGWIDIPRAGENGMRIRQVRWMLAALAALELSGCGMQGRSRDGRYGKPEPPATVLAVNQNFADINLFVVHAGVRTRLGTVTGLSSRRFRIPRTVPLTAASLQILAAPIGSRQTYLSPPVQARPGGSIDLTLGSSLNQSSVAVWDP
jgi:hypothetical protein